MWLAHQQLLKTCPRAGGRVGASHYAAPGHHPSRRHQPGARSRGRGQQQQQQRSSSSRARAAEDVEAGSSRDGAPSLGRLRYNQRTQPPKELQGVTIGEDGSLIDSSTGKAINDFGASRFDVLVRALRGELDPPTWVENTERNSSLLMGSLVQFPCSYTFNAVGKVAPGPSATPPPPPAAAAAAEAGDPGDASPQQQQQQQQPSVSGRQGADGLLSHPFVQDVVACVGRVCQVDVPREAVQVQQRLQGKYLSVAVTVKVRAPEIVTRTFEELGKDPRVTMKF